MSRLKRLEERLRERAKPDKDFSIILYDGKDENGDFYTAEQIKELERKYEIVINVKWV